jgi:TatD DNase family protein
MLLDSHCHLQHCFSSADLDREISAISSSMSYIVDVSTNTSEFLNMKDRSLPGNLLLSFGLYPEEAPLYTPSKGNEFRAMLETGKVMAVGECGIDYHRDYGTHEAQESLFRAQIEACIEKSLPLIVHSRDAFADTYRVLSDYKFKRDVIIHCFGYGAPEAGKFLENGYIISFAGNVTYPGAKSLRDAALTVPDDRLLLETDSPYLPPVPLRGQRNNPLNISHTYKFISGLRNTGEEDLENVIEKNFRRVFGV